MASGQMNGGAMIGLAIILAIILLVFPNFVLYLAWAGIIFLFLGGIVIWLTS